MNNKTLIRRALAFVKSHKKQIKHHFAGDDVCPPETNPVSIFMAGAPGAGKTEFSKRLISTLQFHAVRIDADEIREIIPGYNGTNALALQPAAALGVEYVFDYALKKRKSLILDGTLISLVKSISNIDRSLSQNRRVTIYYVVQDPLLSWRAVQYRGVLEGRFVSKDIFIDGYFKAQENVNELKKIYNKSIVLNIVYKKIYQSYEKITYNVQKVDLKEFDYYTRENLIKTIS